MRRTLVPEILDDLAADDPRAVRSRADLRRINWLMGQAPIMAGLLRRHMPPSMPAGPYGQESQRFLEIGAGDGAPALRLARRLAPHRPNVHLWLLDRAPVVQPDTIAAIRETGWTAEVVTADAFEWLEGGTSLFDVIVSNLFLHHFEGEALHHLLALAVRRSLVFAATEPRRDRPSWLAARMTGLIGGNDVTRHDAPASVRAGFTGAELGEAWARAGGTALEEGRRGPFTHAFVGRGAPGGV